MTDFNTAWLSVFAVLVLAFFVTGCTHRAESGDRMDRLTRTNAEPAASRDDDQMNDAKRGYASINGLRIYYEIHGTGGTPLVLLHGGGSTIDTSFSSVLPSLAQTRQVIAFDQQGHGRTADILDRPFTFEQSADDTAALLHHLSIKRADFFGYSNGGNIALHLAARHPQLVRKLVVASAQIKRDGLYPEFWEFMKRATLQDMPAELREAYIEVAPHPQHMQLFHDKSAKRMLELKDWRLEDVQAIQAPTLIMIGDTDIVRPEHAVEMLRMLPNAQLAVLPGTDHDSVNQNPEVVVSLVRSFLDAAMPKAQ